MKALRIAAAAALLLVSGAANANFMTVAQYKDFKQKFEATHDATWQAMLMYLSGIGQGAMGTIAEYNLNKKGMLFCPPDTLELNGANYQRILEQQIEDADRRGQQSLVDSIPVMTLLISGLEETFPCTK